MIALLSLAAVAGGLAAAVAAGAAERGLRLWGRPARGAWAAALCATALLPPAAWVLSPAVADAVRALTAFDPSAPGVPGLLELPVVVVHAAGAPAAAWLPRLDAWLGAVWIGSAIAGLGTLWRGGRTLRRAARAWTPDVVDGVPVAVSADLGPAVLGVRRPRIVVPAWALTLERPLRALVLRHEVEHARAGDPGLLLAGAALVAVMPWNPAAWLIARRLRAAVEIDCDTRVLRAHPDVARYGLLLLAVAQRRGTVRLPALAALTALAPARSDLSRRIEAMRARPLPPRVRAARTAAHTAGGGAALAALLLACGAPDLVGEGRPRERATVGGPAASVPPLVDVPLSRDPMPNGVPVAPAVAPNPRATGPDAVYFEFQVEQPVRPVDGSRGPRYPAEARAARLEGDVLAQFVVDDSGAVEPSTFKVLRSSAPVFTEAVRTALPTMRFHPARVGGRAVKQLVQQPFAFALSR